MRRSLIVLLLILQILALFICENVYSLFKKMESREIDAILEKADLFAEWLVDKYQGDAVKIGQEKFFDRISMKPGIHPEKKRMEIDRNLFYVIQIPWESHTVVFSKKIHSPLLQSIKNLKNIFSGILIVLGIFILIAGVLLIRSFKKVKTEGDGISLSPLQSYLIELKNLQEELKEIVDEQGKTVQKTEELNKSIVNNINLAIVYLNTEGRIELFNPFAQKIFSQSFSHARNNRLENVIKDFPKLNRFISQNPQRATSEIEEKELIFSVDLIPVSGGGRLVLVRDITAEKKRERIQLLSKNFIMLGEMATFLAHEIKNSLSVILGYSKSMKGDPEKSAKIGSEINFLTSMMESFLNFARPVEPIHLETVDLKELIGKIAEEQKIVCQLPADSMSLPSDAIALHTVFSNLIRNAKEAGADQVEITFVKGHIIEIAVKDNGRPMDPQIKEKIWLPFFSTREKGTGMGLPIVKKMVNALNADIRLVDSADSQTCFKIIFY